MCSSPKSHASKKVLKSHYGGIMSGLDKQARIKFTERANTAADRRALTEKNIGQRETVKNSREVSLLSYFQLALNSSK
ncbi:hypothetical protein [Psychromonas aquimarina]|uniref:hypothetical protein n=1 Tax=Psychromonas aquimarina TaxID=444919 RepID=UPI000405EB25|nr:hypothetical protein [Psychromonas aquimarina]